MEDKLVRLEEKITERGRKPLELFNEKILGIKTTIGKS